MTITFDNGMHRLVPQRFAWPKDMPVRSMRHPSAFEDLGAELVRELARVGWEVPGLDLEFHTSGSGTRVFRSLYRVSGTTAEGPFSLRFGNSQGEDGMRHGCLTGLSEMVIPPGLSLTHWSDTGGSSATLFLTDNWKRDAEILLALPRVNPKLNGEPKRYLRYKGRKHDQFLAHDHDLGREYSPEGGEPAKLSVPETVARVRAYVQAIVDRLSAMPSAPGSEDIDAFGDANLRRLAHVEPVPAPPRFPKLYAWADKHVIGRCNGWGDEDPQDSDFILSGGMTLASGTSDDLGDLPDRSDARFTYATVDPDAKGCHPERPHDDERLPVEITLKWLNDVFVVDRAAYARTRQAFMAAGLAAGRDRYTPQEVLRIGGAVARTMVPALEYEGGYEDPVYLVGRQLRSDEARVMRGPVELRVDAERIVARFTDSESGQRVVLYESDKVVPHHYERAERIATGAAYYMHDRDKTHTRIGRMPPAPVREDPLDFLPPTP